MAPRGQALPQATTESAREARKSFFCELCQKGYARMNEFEAHEGSYDHQHRKRLKEMRQLTKDPNAAAKARERANEESGLKSINLASLSGTTNSSHGTSSQPGKKKPVFKSTLQPHNAALLANQSSSTSKVGSGETAGLSDDDPSGAVANEWSEEAYDPKFMTGCDKPECGVCKGQTVVDVDSIVIPWQLGWEMPIAPMADGVGGRRDVEMGGVS